MPVPVVVLGAGGTGVYIAEVIERSTDMRFLGFLDDDPEKNSEACCGYDVLGPLSMWKSLPNEFKFVTALYSPKRLMAFYWLVEALSIPRERWASVVDPQAVVSRHAVLERGCFVGPGCVVEPRVKLSWTTSLLGNVYVGHDTVLSEYVACANSAAIAGGSLIKTAAYIGENSSIREYLTIGSGAIVGMGAVVCHDVLDGAVVVGNPARPMCDR